MKFPEEYIEGANMGFEKIKEFENERAIRIMENLLLIDAKKIKRKLSKELIGYKLKIIHNDLMFFRSEELLVKLKEFDLENTELRWFVSLSDIDKQFKVIEKKGIIVDKTTAITYIRLHLGFKFSRELLFWATRSIIHDNTRMTILTKKLFDLQKRRRYAEGTPKKLDSFNLLLNSLIKEVENNDEFGFKLFLDYTKGVTENTILRSLLEDCFEDKVNNKTQFFSAVYDLFRIILQDYNLLTEQEYINKENVSERNFNVVKAKRINKIIYKK